jgi:hypothetical protein
MKNHPVSGGGGLDRIVEELEGAPDGLMTSALAPGCPNQHRRALTASTWLSRCGRSLHVNTASASSWSV